MATRKNARKSNKQATSKKSGGRAAAPDPAVEPDPPTSQPDGATPKERYRIAIIGGGCAGLAAAWHLQRDNDFEVHVYEKSWKLGGKAASTRDNEGRIREHGLHIWLGFYENAFAMMREVYAETARMDPRPPLMHTSVEDAFFPEPHLGVAGLDVAKEGTIWSGFLPPAKGLPGEPFDEESNPFTLANYLLRCFGLLKALMLSVIAAPSEDRHGEPRPDARSRVDEALDLDFSFSAARSPTVLVERMAQLLRTGALTTAAGLLQGVSVLERVLRQLNFAPQVADSALELLEAIAAQARKQLRDIVSIDPKLRWKTEIIDIVIAISVGLYRDRVLFGKKGLDAINHIDYRKWLMSHGASRTTVDSPFITGIYDLVFAYANGDRKHPALAAGVALRGALRMFFTYRGSMFWRMRSGMGEAVFAPLYRALLATKRLERGGGGELDVKPVTFHFLHELKAVEFSGDKKEKPLRVSRLSFRTVGSPDALDALGDKALDKAGCWPDGAIHFRSAIDAQPIGERVLDDGKGGFDAVIFAMGVEDFLAACAGGRPAPGPPPERSFYARMGEKWERMGREVKTVATQAAQVWLDKDLDELGWHRGSGLITALQMPFQTWGDMTHTLTAEQRWRDKTSRGGRGARSNAKSVAYFCGVLPQHEIDKRIVVLRARAERDLAPLYEEYRMATTSKQAKGKRKAVKRIEAEIGDIRAKWQANGFSQLDRSLREKVEADLEALLKKDLKLVWPAAFEGGGTALDDAVGRPHAQANYLGSHRYTLSLPGSIDDRISPLDQTVENMVIAGDWTACGLDASCVEAAVMSGMLAAHAFSNELKLTSIVGYDHP